MNFDIDHGFGLHTGSPEEPTPAPDLVWREFAAAAGVRSDGGLPDPATVAEHLNRDATSLPHARLYDQLSEVVTTASGTEPGENPARLSDFIRRSQAPALAQVIAAGKNISHRQGLLQALVDLVDVAAVLPLLRVAASAYGQPLSPVMTALLDKSERRALEAAAEGKHAAATHRELASRIVETWSEGSVDTTGTAYESVFGEEAAQVDSLAPGMAPEPERVIALSFETGALGGAVWNALARLGSSDRGARQILDMLKAAPDTKAAEMVAQQVATPARLATLLREDSLDFDAVDALLARMNEAAGGTLLDALIDAKSSALRTLLLQRIAALGQAMCPLTVERLLSETRAHALREMLMVVREARCDLKEVPLEKFIKHDDVRVRREAMRLLFEDPIERDRAVVAALRDPDVGMLKVGLKAARESLPEAAVPVLTKRVVEPSFPAEYRTSVLQLLTQSQSMLALEVLLGYAVGGKTLTGKPMLAPKSPEMLIALSGLARVWPNERRVVDLFERARKSSDPEIADALNATHRISVPELDDADDE